MKTSDILLYGLIGFAAYELFLKPGATPTGQTVVHPVAPSLPLSSSTNTVSTLSTLLQGVTKLLGGSSASNPATPALVDTTGLTFTPITSQPVQDPGVLQVTDSTGVTAFSTGGIFDPNATDQSALPTTLPITDLSA
jgi:hypothetical protein